MKKALCALVLAALTACATAHGPAGYDGDDSNVVRMPIVQIINKNFQDAGIYLENARIATVSGLTGNELVVLQPSRIPPDRKLHFSYKLLGDAAVRYELPIVLYQGRKMLITIEEHTPASSAWKKGLGNKPTGEQCKQTQAGWCATKTDGN